MELDNMPQWPIDEEGLWEILNDINPSPSTESSSSSEWSVNTDITWNSRSDYLPRSNHSRSASRVDLATSQKTSVLAKINRKASELAAKGIDERDVEKLKTRLAFLWDQESNKSGKQVTAVTTWRASSARRAYALVQEANPHMLIPVVLAVPPTECSTPTFKDVLPELLHDHRYISYQPRLNAKTIAILQNLALDSRLISATPGYAQFLRSILPRGALDEQEAESSGTRTYSSISMDDLPTMLQSLTYDVYGSEQAITETLEARRSSECASIVMSESSNDCVVRFLISQQAAADAISRFGLVRRITE